MKKLNKIFFLSIFFIILTTFNPNNYKSFQIVENQGLFNIQKIDYPNILAVSGINDPRVMYWEPTKWVAKFRERSKFLYY